MKRRSSWFHRHRPFFPGGQAPRRPSRNRARLVLEVLEERALLNGAQLVPLPPVPSNDVQPTDGPTPLVLDTLSYFSVVDGSPLVPSSVKITTPPRHGTAVINPASGNITYTASPGFAGTDLIGFTVADANGLTAAPAYVTEVVSLPVANPDNIDTDAGNPVTIAVLANDSSLAAPLVPASVAVVNSPAHGTAVVDPATGAITYTSQASFSGTDTFTYTVKDQNGVVSNPATVSVVVNRPQANDDFATTPAGTAVVIAVLGNDTDPDGPNKLNPASLQVLTGPAHGGVAVNPATGDITYTPANGFAGADSFTYTVTDVNNAVSNPATVSIAVQQPTGQNVINPVTVDTDAGNPVTIDVLAADSSTVGLAPATVAVSSGPAHGSTTMDPTTGAITYTPAPGFAGTDSFIYSVKDNNGSPAGSATVSVVVNRPKANDDFATTPAGQPVVIAVLGNDTDPDGPNKLDPASVQVVTGPAHGSATVDPATGAVTYTPAAGFGGADSFTYTVADVNNAVSNVATVNVVVTRPAAADAFGTTDSGFPITIPTLASVTDPAGPSALAPGGVTIVTEPAHGTATVDPATGAITYQSVFGFNGTDTLTYTAADVSGAVSNVATISIVVNRPTAEPDAATTSENMPVVLNVAANDSDPDGNQFLVPGSVTVVTPPAHGSLAVSGPGVLTYTPAPGFVGTDTFAYTIADDHGAVSNPATDTITVHSPAPVYLPPSPPPPSPVGQSPDALFVAGLYRDILGRQPDAAGLNFWLGQLQQGVSRAAVAQDILDSDEHLIAEVSSFYNQLLNRAPDAGGLAYWVGRLRAGATEEQVALGFLTSPEFLAQNNTSGQFVQALYDDVLGRDADAAGLASWKAAIDSGRLTPGQVALGILDSAEAQMAVVDAFYAAFLGRTPDAAGEAAWLNALQGNQAADVVAAGFLASAEYAEAVAAGLR